MYMILSHHIILFQNKDLAEWALEVGIEYTAVECDKYFDIVKEVGPQTAVYKFVPLMQFWRRYWFDTEEALNKTSNYPIMTSNINDDLKRKTVWPEIKDIFKRSFIFMARRGWFKDDSKFFQKIRYIYC